MLLSQNIDHWETIVFDSDLWRYHVGNTAPEQGWQASTFDDGSWQSGLGGFGYGDGDDQTLIPNTISVYIRHRFDIFDLDDIQYLILNAGLR